MAEKKQKIKLFSLWRKTVNVNGIPTEVLSGYLGDTQISIWPNGYKKSEKSPDLVAYVEPRFFLDPKNDGGPSEQNGFYNNSNKIEEYTDDDIPF
jgi:hypothetical protein